MNNSLKNTLFLVLALSYNTAFGQTADEYSTKTAFMVKMTNFINWPDNSDNSDNNQNGSIFTICLEGPQNKFASLHNWASSGIIKQKPVILQYINDSLSNLASCNILYITEEQNLETYLDISHKEGILTISDKPGNAHRGVLVNFSNTNKNISFEINLDAAKRIGFKINPRLLKLATIVSSQRELQQ